MKNLRTCLILVAALLLLLFGCAEKKNDNSKGNVEASVKIKSDIEKDYKTIDSDSLSNEKFSANIIIKKEISENDIRDIFNNFKEENPGYKNYFIHFYLENMIVGSGAWATANEQENNLKISIQGFTEKEAAQVAEQDYSDAIGVWKWNMMSATITLKEKKGKYIIELLYGDGSSGEEICLKGEKNGLVSIYDPNNDFGEFYLINSNGELEIWDEDGKFDALTVVKYPKF